MRLSDHFLTAVGGVVGLTAGFIMAPYLMVDGKPPGTEGFGGLLEGWGDVYGGALGGVLSFAAAYFVFWLERRRDKELEREARIVASDALLFAITPIVAKWEAFEAQLTAPAAGLQIFATTPILHDLSVACDELIALPSPDPVLGRQIRVLFFGLRLAATTAKPTFDAAHGLAASSAVIGPTFGQVMDARNRAFANWEILNQGFDMAVKKLADISKMAKKQA